MPLTRLFTLTALAVSLSAATAERAFAQDAAIGEDVYQSVCKNCHGPKAQGMASYPKLNDKDADYIAGLLIRYRDGEKIGPNSALMIPHDEEIAGLALYVTTAFD